MGLAPRLGRNSTEFCCVWPRDQCFTLVLEFIVCAALPAKSLNKLIGKVDWIHFVGTGRDYLGFALARFARTLGVRFTVWPAVHPRDWGDDVLDVRLYRKADTVMCQTSYEKRHLAGLGVPEGKLLSCGLPPMCLADGNADSIRRELELDKSSLCLVSWPEGQGEGLFRFASRVAHRFASVPGGLSSPRRPRRSVPE